MASNAGEEESTVIAIDSDRNSLHAVKWAVEHLLKKNASCTLIHVRTKTLYSHDFEVIPKQGRLPTEEELHQFFLPFRGFCARKGIVAKELVLHDIDVSNALTDYIIDNSISNIVVGASRWNALIRKFKDADVATSLVRSVPETCTVHVISKGKVQNIRPAGHSQNISNALSKSLKGIKGSFQSEDLNRKSVKYGHKQGSNNDGVSLVTPRMTNGETTSPKLSDESCSSQNSSNRSSLTGDTSKLLGYQLTEMSPENQDVVENSGSYTFRSNSCKISQAMKHEKFTQKEDAVKAWLPEEATLTLTEVERKKTKASMESAEMLKCLAEMKSHKGKQTGIRAMHEEEERNKALNASACNNKILFKRYNIKEIEVATNYFDNALKIGEGGYGPVFKGVLDHTEVAIKALKPDISQGERQFQQEVNVLSTIKHPNMVQLLGACPEYGCLVYEYIENGSLEDRLFQKDNTPTIPWKVRFKIASEIATGLLFLHQTKPEPVVHRDLKPANILLDRNYASKITDVGLARLVPPSVANKTTQYHKTTAAGTFCYIDPEYQQTGLLGVKSDIYSLGVMLLQIITGKPPMGVAHLVEEAIDKGKLQEVLDPNVTDWPLEETLSYARLALKCCEMRKRDRPDLRSVILPELNRLRNL
ncbi:putative U-box domain-containing protein 53 [Glycine soja]|uniref:U-box domain-containing protein 51 n=1 Tax=Glycine soja TaxID=3848 RepID=A0A445IEE6_GLYSO|nr:putative U-box domain-containing protein 53 [Glycine max]XP_028186670.1 putative U-box domain-containing protein 53 [Glycine soja]RZB84431.1 U-box domain-containing protein 51 [Glycine soja]|eukprot:XP_006595468.1 putative U-box domain-containing protein 53 [Glycine max]